MKGRHGYTLIELLVVSTMILILASAIMPLARVTATRTREAELRRALREMRTAIDKFKDAADLGNIGSLDIKAGSENYPADLQTLSVKLTARMLLLGHVARNEEDAAARVHEAIATGRGLDKFRQMVEQQGGDPRVVDDYSRLPAAPHRQLFRAARAGYVTRLDAELVGRATMILGAGRARVDDTIDPGVGAIVRAKVGESVQAGDSIIELHYRDGAHLDQALEFLRRACAIDDAPPSSVPLVLEIGSRVRS